MDNNIVSSLPVEQQSQIFSKKIGTKVLTGSAVADMTGNVTKSLGQAKVNAVVYSENVDWDNASFKVNKPWIGKLHGDMEYGYHNYEGLEESNDTRFCSAFFQTEAKPLPKGTMWSLNGRLETKYYNYASAQVDRVGSFFKEQDDYNFHKALLDGFSEAVTTETAWADTGLEDEMPDIALHPRIFVNGANDFVSWNSNDTTYRTAVTTALDARTTSDYFGSAAIESLCELARTFLDPIEGGILAGKNARYIIMLSPQQLFQLRTEDSLFFKRFDNGAVAKGENPNITGEIGTYQDCLFITNTRAPVWNVNSGAGSISFVKPSTSNNTAAGAAARVTRVVKTGAASDQGTFEIAIALGNKALIKLGTEIQINNKSFNYNTNDGMLGIRMQGLTRYEAKKSGVQPLNESSLLFMTPSTRVY